MASSNFIKSYCSFETISALAFMTYIVNLDAYELYTWDEKVFNGFIMNARVLPLHITRVDCYSEVYM